MRHHKQLFRHRPDEGIFGDCLRTAVACLLDLEPADLPHEHRAMTNVEHNAIMDAFLHERGIHRIGVALTTDDIDVALETVKTISDGLPCLFSGTSGNGCNHVVIVQHGRIVHDPAQDDSGIIGPTDTGQFIIEWLVSPAAALTPGQSPEGGVHAREARP